MSNESEQQFDAYQSKEAEKLELKQSIDKKKYEQEEFNNIVGIYQTKLSTIAGRN